jgi:4-hydroxybenzoate polyprenyltransferase
MKVLKSILNFYLNGSIHVALSVYALTWVTLIQFGIDYDENSLYFVFYASITGYNFVKYFGVAKFHHRSLASWLKAIQVFSLVAFLALCYYASQLEIKTLILIGILGLITFLYAIPLLPQKYFIDEHKNLRQISYLKIIVVAAVWAGFTVLLPVVDSNQEIKSNVIFLLLQRFLIVVVLILPFDIRDVQYDAISLQTIPKKIGVEKTKRLGLMLMVFSLVLEYLFATESLVKTPFMIFFFLVILFLMRAKTTQSKYYSSFWVESLPLVWWLLLLGFHNF